MIFFKKILPLIFSLLLSEYIIAQSPASAMIAFNEGNLEKAKERIEKSILEPKHFEKSKTWYYRGLIFKAIAEKQIQQSSIQIDDNPIEKSLVSFQKALLIEPNDKQSAKEITDLYNPAITYGLKLYKENKLESALSAFEIGQNLKPNDLFTLIYCEYISFSLKKNEKYKSVLQRLINIPLEDYNNYNGGKEENNKINKQVYYAKLANYFKDEEKDLVKADVYCKKGLKEFPDENILRSTLLDIYFKGNKFNEAIGEAKALIQKNPNNSRAYFNLGVIYENLGQTNNLIDAYEKAVLLDPKYYDALYNLGAYFYNRGAEILNNYSAIDSNKITQSDKANFDNGIKEFIKAQPYFEKLNKEYPNDLLVLKTLLNIYIKTEQIEKAKMIQEKLNSIKPISN